MSGRGPSTLGHSSSISSARNSLSDGEPSMLDDEQPVRPRTMTPIEERQFERVPDEMWYVRLGSECAAAWENVGRLWNGPDCWSKLYSVLYLITLPLRVLVRAATPHNEVTIPDHASVCYLFLLMCYTFVINLIELGKNKHPSSQDPHQVRLREYFVSGCMVLSIAAMLYLYLFTKDRVLHDPCHDAPIRIFFRGGLYIFGFASMVDSICLAVDEWHCQQSDYKFHRGAATVQVLKAMFMVVETLFLGYFHKAHFPLNTAFLQIFLAHILGTNLMLWFWTLCEEAIPVNISNCTRKPLDWDSNTQKYFYPVFIEYLILAISILYELWIKLADRNETYFQYCRNCAVCLYRNQNRVPEVCQNNQTTESLPQRYLPRCGFGIMFGTIYVVLFLVVMLMAIHSKHGKTDEEGHFKIYCYGSFILYLSEICAGFVILVSIRSPSNLQRVRSIDYDDALLYISLMGILLLEGFHMMNTILKDLAHFHVLAVDISGTVQHLTQTVTLMNLRHYGDASRHRNKTWIRECILFLLLTNIAWWIEDSFYLEPVLTRPGEGQHKFQDLKTYGYIVKPMVIFFRFHSATYFFSAWTIYKQ